MSVAFMLKLACVFSIVAGASFFSVLETPAQIGGSTEMNSAALERDLLRNYLEISSLPDGLRQKAIAELGKESKAALYRFHLAFQLVKRPVLSAEQVALILEAIGFISPADYDRTQDRSNTLLRNRIFEARAKAIFPPKEVFEMLATMQSLGSDRITLNRNLDILDLSSNDARRAFFTDLDPVDKRSLWKTKLALSLVTEDLNEQQREILSQAISLLSHESIYTPGLEGESKRQRDTIETKALSVFSKFEVYKLFFSLSGEYGCSRSAPGTDAVLFNPRPCTCLYSEWCQLVYGWLSTCQAGACDVASGCGVFGDSDCSGVCTGVI